MASGRIYRFGEFVFDPLSGELRVGARRVRLRPQPALVLAYLLQYAGELVSREELRRLLWPNGTFVQFDDGLNSCIKQVRAALDDARVDPRYVETVPRRGYRFIGDATMGRVGDTHHNGVSDDRSGP